MCISIYLSLSIYIYMWLYIYIYICIYTYVHIHICVLSIVIITIIIINICVIIVIVYGRFPKCHRVFLGRDAGTLKSDIVSKKQHPQSICPDLRLSNWKFEDWHYGNRPYDYYCLEAARCNSHQRGVQWKQGVVIYYVMLTYYIVYYYYYYSIC